MKSTFEEKMAWIMAFKNGAGSRSPQISVKARQDGTIESGIGSIFLEILGKTASSASEQGHFRRRRKIVYYNPCKGNVGKVADGLIVTECARKGGQRPFHFISPILGRPAIRGEGVWSAARGVGKRPFQASSGVETVGDRGLDERRVGRGGLPARFVLDEEEVAP